MLRGIVRTRELPPLRQPSPQQIIVIAVCITVLVTFYSLSELQTLLATSSSNQQPRPSLPGHHDVGAAGYGGGATYVATAAGSAGDMMLQQAHDLAL